MLNEQPSGSAKREFGARLRELRRDAGLSGTALAAACGWHKSKVSKIEKGTQRTTDADLMAWTAACGADQQLTELIAANREIEFMWNDYKRLHRVGMKNLQAQSMDLFGQARLIRVYESLFIPGFLQTRDYAVAQFTIHAKLHGLPLGDVEEAAENRMARKRFLGTGAPVFVFILEVSALANNTGGVEVMGRQFDYLLEVIGCRTCGSG